MCFTVERFYTACNHCGKGSIHQAEWIIFAQHEKHTYKCGWCGKLTESSYTFAHPTLVNLFLKDVPITIYQYPIPAKDLTNNQ